MCEAQSWPAIVKVDALDSDYISVDLSSGHAMLLDFSGAIKTPKFARCLRCGSLTDRRWTTGGCTGYPTID